MQRLAGDFLVKQAVMYHLENGNITELYELPNGQWQFGKGREATVVTSLEQVENLDPDTKARVGEWLKRMKSQPTPVAVQQGQTPLLAGNSVRDQLSQALAVMPEEAISRLLLVVQQVMAPIADSLKQGAAVNSHEDGYGQDAVHHAPGSIEAPAYQLPPGARWVDDRNPASGYFTFDSGVTDELGHPTAKWHPTPEFHVMTTRPEPTPITETTPLKVHDPLEEEMAKERELAGAGAGRGKSKRRR